MISGEKLLSRFEGDDGQRRLGGVLRSQKMIAGSAAIAEALRPVGNLVAVDVGEAIIEEGSSTNDLFFVIAGAFSVVVKGSEVARRGVGDHLGEQALLDPAQPRTATVTATEPSVVFRVAEPDFDIVASSHPELWKHVARELSSRLIQRNRQLRTANDQVQVFIISAKEDLWIAEEVRSNLNSHDILCTVWTDGIFRAGHYSLEALEGALDDKDFAIAVAAPDDFSKVRGEDHVVPRDNVVFELGLFMGKIGRKRTLLLESRDEDVKLPTDLLGLTTIPYRSGPREKLPVLLGGACHEIRRVINQLGPIR